MFSYLQKKVNEGSGGGVGGKSFILPPILFSHNLMLPTLHSGVHVTSTSLHLSSLRGNLGASLSGFVKLIAPSACRQAELN